ncbi:Peptide deformylase 2 [Paraliobacillus sp. PM-2]|uniref:peptide deformylase n=1 Tax=Paraliobacillus sp. PM-2 TaxID=1462524 RepID=UPI00061C4B31|nr:peptide deformylase [Paraliobacillus sp. PM-2]CQR47837.1 Peptide deformylase 2 [Paraliobacillus sp. PM-2]
MITMEDIVREGNPILEQTAKPVELPIKDQDKDTLKEMLQYLKNSQDEKVAEKYHLRPGVGLAAPQIGLSKRMIAVHFEDFNGKQYSEGLINPKIVSHSVEKTFLSNGEGCLSVDREVPGYVPRYAKITVKATNINGDPIKWRLRGYAAIVLQHEIDHLNGVMFYDHINKANPFQVPENTKACDID